MTQHNLYTIGDTQATKLTSGSVHSGQDITLQNVNDTGYIYVGGEGVSSNNYGYRIMPNHAISFELAGEDALYVVSSIADMNLAVISIALESQGG